MAKKSKEFPMQSIFIKKIKASLPPNLGIAEEMADILEISIDSAYRRIRGETELSIDEAFKLTQKYNISMDGLFSSSGDTVTFAYTKLTDDTKNFEKYLGRIFTHTNQINGFDSKKITYIAETFPLFYSFFSEKLTRFKLFYWQRSVLNIPEFQDKKFEFGIISNHQAELAMSSFKVYQNIPSVEVWTDDTIKTALKQIEYYCESGVFLDKKDALAILEELKLLVLYLKECTESGRKLPSAKEENFTLFQSEVTLGTNCIYIETGDVKHAYISFNTLNSLTTNNQEFCEETEHWVKNIIKKSTLITGAGEKQRFQFFNKMMSHIEQSQQKISAG